MCNVEIIITPLFELRIECLVMSVTCFLERSMEMARVILVEVVRGQVCATSKPPLACSIGLFYFKKAIVKVNGWHHRVTWVDDTADTSSKER